MFGMFPSRGVWRRPGLHPVDLLVFAALLDLLRRGFSADEARRQLDIAIEWGRYGELFEYDAESGQLALGSDPARSGHDLPWGHPRVGVSSCLLGEEVRFNGGHKRYRFLTDSVDPVRRLGALLPGNGDRARYPARGDPADRRRAPGQPQRHRRPYGGHGGPAAARGPGRLRVQSQVAELRHPRHPPVPGRRPLTASDETRRAAADHSGPGLYA